MYLLMFIVCIWVLYLIFIFPIRTSLRLRDLSEEVAMLRDLLNHVKRPVSGHENTERLPISKTTSNVREKTNSVINVSLKTDINTKKSFDLERQIATRFPVWIGGTCLVFAAFFMIQYSIEQSVLSVPLRLIISSSFGILLMLSSVIISLRPKIANGKNIRQALAGAGIAVLYLSIFAATNLYALLSISVGFSAMAFVTALCIVWSLSQGAPIAMMGLISGLLTPLAIKTQINTALLFIYLYVVLLGTFLVIRKNNWWWLAVIAIIGAFVWTFSWATLFPIMDNSLWLAFFVLATVATFFAIFHGDTPYFLKEAITIISLLFLALITFGVDYAYREWGLLSILVIGVIILSIRDSDTYKILPWFTMILLAIMIYNWNSGILVNKIIVIVGFGLLFTVSSYVTAMLSVHNKHQWLIQAAIANGIFFLLTYLKVKPLLPKFTDNLLLKYVWSNVAFVFAVIWSYTAWQAINKLYNDKTLRKYTFNISCIAATAFISVGLLLAVDAKFFAIVFASELFLIGLLSTKVKIGPYGNIAIVLIHAIAFALLYQYDYEPNSFTSLPLLYYGVPAAFLALSSILFRGKILELYIQIIEIFSIFLLSILGTTLLNNLINAFSADIAINHKYLLRGLYINYFMLFGLVCIILLGNHYKRIACELAGFSLIALAIIMIIRFDIMKISSVLNISVGSTPILNALLLPYALPALWLTLWQKNIIFSLQRLGLPYVGYIKSFVLLLIFIWLTLSVRQYFYRTDLLVLVTKIEIYMYSIVWLLFGLALLILGIGYKNKQLRVASLLILILTISKVFWFDASELTGILRVFSFFGLGVGLIAIGWFYARFVFKQDQKSK